MKTKFPLFAVIGAAALMTGGCTFPSKGTVYDRRSAGRTMSVQNGEIVAVREATLSGRTTIVGTGGGGLVGGAAASGVGHGVGTAIASAGGAVVGAVVGEATEERVTRKDAQEVTVKLPNGEKIIVVQAVGADGAFAVGEQVQVMQGGGESTLRRY